MEADQRHKPFTWLQTVWLPSIKEVAELAEKHGNKLGQFSIEETRAVLFLNRNNKNAAVDTLIDNRRKQVTIHYNQGLGLAKKLSLKNTQ